VVGQCWSTKSSDAAIDEIFISPKLADPVEVLDTLTHELVHAVDNCEHKHGKEFKAIARRIRFQGKNARSVRLDLPLKQKLTAIALKLELPACKACRTGAISKLSIHDREPYVSVVGFTGPHAEILDSLHRTAGVSDGPGVDGKTR
jgi:hypothetical protein